MSGYLPKDAEWYTLYGSKYGELVSTGTSKAKFEAPHKSTAPVFVRSGFIIPRQTPEITLTESHKQNFQLLIVCGGAFYFI